MTTRIYAPSTSFDHYRSPAAYRGNRRPRSNWRDGVPSERQLDFMYSLAEGRVAMKLGADAVTRVETLRARVANGVTAGDVSDMIDWLKQQPRDTGRQPAKTVEAKPGVYELPTGEIYVVKPNRTKTRLYAKRLVTTSSDRLNANGDHVKVDFEYEQGAIYKIRPEHRMSLERAQELTIKFSHCIVCGRKLKVAQSVERGIGPVCITYFE